MTNINITHMEIHPGKRNDPLLYAADATGKLYYLKKLDMTEYEDVVYAEDHWLTNGYQVKTYWQMTGEQLW